MSRSAPPLDEVVFPWNAAVTMTGPEGERAVVLCLSAVFDAIQALRADVRRLADVWDERKSE